MWFGVYGDRFVSEGKTDKVTDGRDLTGYPGGSRLNARVEFEL